MVEERRGGWRRGGEGGYRRDCLRREAVPLALRCWPRGHTGRVEGIGGTVGGEPATFWRP